MTTTMEPGDEARTQQPFKISGPEATPSPTAATDSADYMKDRTPQEVIQLQDIYIKMLIVKYNKVEQQLEAERSEKEQYRHEAFLLQHRLHQLTYQIRQQQQGRGAYWRSGCWPAAPYHAAKLPVTSVHDHEEEDDPEVEELLRHQTVPLPAVAPYYSHCHHHYYHHPPTMQAAYIQQCQYGQSEPGSDTSSSRTSASESATALVKADTTNKANQVDQHLDPSYAEVYAQLVSLKPVVTGGETVEAAMTTAATTATTERIQTRSQQHQPAPRRRRYSRQAQSSNDLTSDVAVSDNCRETTTATTTPTVAGRKRKRADSIDSEESSSSSSSQQQHDAPVVGTNSSGSRLECLKCDQVFKSNTAYMSHMKFSLQHDANNINNWHYCKVCDKKYHPRVGTRHKICRLQLRAEEEAAAALLAQQQQQQQSSGRAPSPSSSVSDETMMEDATTEE